MLQQPDDNDPLVLSGWGALPHDLLLAIDAHLFPEDRYACLHVCRQWYSVFCPLFYTRVSVQSAQQCIQLSEHLNAIGHAIKELNVDLSTDDLEKWAHPLPSRCPSLRVFRASTFTTTPTAASPHNSRSPSPPHHHHDDGATTRPSKMTPCRSTLDVDVFWTLPHSLTTLSLSIRQLPKDSVLRLLSQVPRLTRLHLNWINGFWSCADMDAVHASCPELTHVWISAETFLTHARTQRHGLDDDADDELMGVAEPSADWIEQLFPVTAAGSAAGSRLVSFHLSIYRGLSEHMCDWFVYAARNYPMLEAFALEMRPSHQERVGLRPFEFDLLDMLMTYKWTSSVWKQAAIPALSIFAQACTRVRSIHLFQLYLPRPFLESLFIESGRKIQEFGCTRNIHTIWRVDPSNWFFCSTLVSLSLQACITAPATNASFMQFLSLMPCLRHLHLTRYESFSFKAFSEACTQLETLTLEQMPLLEDTDEQEHVDSDDGATGRLHTIVITHAILKDLFFKHIRRGLRRLVMKHSAIIGGTTPCCAQVQLPTAVDLESMQLEQMMFETRGCMRKVVKASDRQRFALIGLEQTTASQCQWYDLRQQQADRSNNGAPERVLGIRPLDPGRSDDADLLDDNIYSLRIICNSVERILVNGDRLLGRPM